MCAPTAPTLSLIIAISPRKDSGTIAMMPTDRSATIIDIIVKLDNNVKNKLVE